MPTTVRVAIEEIERDDARAQARRLREALQRIATGRGNPLTVNKEALRRDRR